MKAARIALLVALGALAATAQEPAAVPEVPAATAESHWSGYAEASNRWLLTEGGNREVYRSVVNLGEGPRLTDAGLRYQNPAGRFADTFDLSFSSWGGDPYNTARLSAAKAGLYDLRLDYRNVAYFNNLPSFANPLLGQGILLSQRAFDIQRRQLDTEIAFKPRSVISPYLAYTRAESFGRGVTTFVTDGNEFPLGTRLDDALNSLRGGVRINLSRFHVTLEQGRTSYGDTSEIRFSGPGHQGNRGTPLFGRDLRLDGLRQVYDVTGEGLFNRALVTGQPWHWLSFTGQFFYSQPEIDVRQDLNAEGAFLLQRALAPFASQIELATGDAQMPHNSGSWNTELRPFSRLRIVQSWYTDRFHVAANSLVSNTFDTQPPASDATAFADRLVLNYNQHQVDAIWDLTSRVSIRGGHRYVWGDARVREPSLSFPPVDESRGAIRRHVGLAGGRVRVTQRFTMNVDFEASPNADTFFRTGLVEYQRAKWRGQYRLASSLAVAGSFAVLNNRDPAPAVDFEMRSQQTSASLQWTPGSGRRFSLLADYTRATLRTDLPAVLPPFFTRETLRFRDFGHHAGTYVDLGLAPRARLSLGGSFSINSGSRPTRYYQPQARLSVPLAGKMAWTAEWRWFAYTQRFLALEDFRTHVFATGLRLGL